MPLPLRHLLRKRRYGGGSARRIESGIPQIYSRTSDRFGATRPLVSASTNDRFPPNPVAEPSAHGYDATSATAPANSSYRALIVSGTFRVVAEVARRNNWMPMSR